MARRSLLQIAVAALLTAVGSSAALAQSTAITYQGQLKNGGVSVNAPADLQFRLFSAASGGTQIGDTVTLTNVNVSDGLFTSSLDFGFNPYTSNQPLFLQILVRFPAGAGPFASMGARQELTGVPYSLATRGLDIDAQGNITLDSGGDRTLRVPDEPANVPNGSNGKNISIIAGNSSTPNFSGSKGGSVVIQGGLGNNVGLPFSAGGDVVLRTGANALFSSQNPNGGSIIFETGGADSTFNERMRLTDKGALGFGTATPLYKFHVVGTGTVTNASAPYAMFETTDGQFGPQIRLKHGGAGGQDWLMLSSGEGNGVAGTFQVYRQGAAVAAIVVTATDNVGIGTSSPQDRLHVAGNLRFDNELRFGTQTWNGATGTNLKWSRSIHSGGNASNFYMDMSCPVATPSAWILQNNGQDRIYMDSNGTTAKPGGGAWGVLSDERTKNDIQPMTGTLNRLLQLKGHAYTYKPEFVEKGRALPGVQIGLVAQEVETVFPDWVTTGSDGLKQVTERSTTALMVEALRDLRTEKDAEIANLKARLEKIEAMLSAQAK